MEIIFLARYTQAYLVAYLYIYKQKPYLYCYARQKQNKVSN
jgi:hypothetical protein